MLVRFLRDQRGNFTVLSSVMMVTLAGAAGLVADYGSGLYNRLEDQRIADTAAVAGARVYDETQSSTAVTTAVNNVAALNGISSGFVSSTIVSSPTGDGNQAVSVVIRSAPLLTFSRLLRTTASNTLPVQANAYAEMKPGGAGCVIALDPSGSGVTLTGSGTISAPNCAVASNQTINCHSSSNPITTKYAYYDTSSLNCGSNSNKDNWIQAPSGYTLSESRLYTADPLAGTSEVLGQTGRLSTVEGITSPSPPTVPAGTDLAFTSSFPNAILTGALTAQGCTGTFASSTWTVTCSGGLNLSSGGGHIYTFGKLVVASGVTVNFNLGGSSSTTYNFALVNSGGGVFNFGPGTYNIAQGILTTNGSSSIAVSFAAGTFNIGYPSSATACNSSYYYSICWGAGTLTFAGPSTFVLAGGIYAKASTSVTMGSSGSTNSFNIGEAHDNNSLYMGSSAQVILGDATGGSDIFQMSGNVNLTNGGICLKVGAAAQHDINGFFLTAGGNVLGSGVYTVSQYVSLGGSNGGDVTCWGTDTGVTASGVTFVVGGTTLDGSGHAFYLGAGYANVSLTAPTSGPTQNLAVIGPTSSTNTGTALFTEGSTNASISGAFYFPYASITQNGASGINIGNGSGQCLEMIGSQVSITNGGAMASSCNIPGVGTGGASGLVSLVQ